jgi:hypothetical protein
VVVQALMIVVWLSLYVTFVGIGSLFFIGMGSL